MNNGNKSFKKAKVGRPNQGYEKHIMRSVVSDPRIEEYLRGHPEENASEIFRTAVYSLMPKGDKKIRLDRLEKEIKEIRIQIKMKELEVQDLRNKIEFEESIKLDIRLEEDCAAWYFRDLIIQKKIGAYFSIFTKRNQLTYDYDKIKKQYYLLFDLESFLKKLELENDKLKIMPLDWYKQFKPVIFEEGMKETVKNRMRPEYLKKEVKVEIIEGEGA